MCVRQLPSDGTKHHFNHIRRKQSWIISGWTCLPGRMEHPAGCRVFSCCLVKGRPGVCRIHCRRLLHFVNICGSFEAENAGTNFLPPPRLSVWTWQVKKKMKKIFKELRETGTLYWGVSTQCTCVQPSKNIGHFTWVSAVLLRPSPLSVTRHSISTVSHTP